MTLLSDRIETAAPVIPTEPKKSWEQTALVLFVVLPFAAVLASGFVLWGHGIGWVDVLIAVGMLEVAGHGITVGFHRYFTHGSFKAKRPLKIALAVAGSLAVEGPVIRWVADHRRHHAFSDRPGDPHSPHEYGEGFKAQMKGLWHAHIGWLFDPQQTSLERYAPDLLADDDLVRIHRMFPALVAVSLLLPAFLGLAITQSLAGMLTAFFWGSLVRVFVLHHVTWSINSLCHTFGNRPFKTRDKSTNFWPLAVISMGESWHNLHHADPTAARHGVDRGQLDSSARLIWLFEKTGLAYDVRWPTRERLDKARA
ncbi:MAG TPA: acyl-CoA desaturase [Frankiaceae bacterium]|jgi:stearoyl-CoA desaturase (delta-9 desaturase)|nr:acyl-CoA desaturase [Frankiaceae bacterium]